MKKEFSIKILLLLFTNIEPNFKLIFKNSIPPANSAKLPLKVKFFKIMLKFKFIYTSNN